MNNLNQEEKNNLINSYIDNFIQKENQKKWFSKNFNKFKNKWNEYKYVRLAAWVALVWGTVIATISGALAVAWILITTRAAVSSIGWFVTTDAIFDIINEKVTKDPLEKLLTRSKNVNNKKDLELLIQQVLKDIENNSKEEICNKINQTRKKIESKNRKKTILSTIAWIWLWIFWWSRILEVASNPWIKEIISSAQNKVWNILSSNNIIMNKSINSNLIKDVFDDIKKDHPKQWYVTIEQSVRRIEWLKNSIWLHESEKLNQFNTSVATEIRKPWSDIIKTSRDLWYLKEWQNFDEVAKKLTQDKIEKILLKSYENDLLIWNKIDSIAATNKVDDIALNDIAVIKNKDTFLNRAKNVWLWIIWWLGSLFLWNSLVLRSRNKKSLLDIKNEEILWNENNINQKEDEWNKAPLNLEQNNIFDKKSENQEQVKDKADISKKIFSKKIDDNDKIIDWDKNIFTEQKFKINSINDDWKDKSIFKKNDCKIHYNEDLKEKSLNNNWLSKEKIDSIKWQNNTINNDIFLKNNQKDFINKKIWLFSIINKNFWFKFEWDTYKENMDNYSVLFTKKTIWWEFALSVNWKQNNIELKMYWFDHWICKYENIVNLKNVNSFNIKNFIFKINELLEKNFIDILIKRDEIKNEEFKNNFHTVEISRNDLFEIYKLLSLDIVKKQWNEFWWRWFQSIYDLKNWVLKMHNLVNPTKEKWEIIATPWSIELSSDFINNYTNEYLYKTFPWKEWDLIKKIMFNEIKSDQNVKIFKMSWSIFTFNWHKHPDSHVIPSESDLSSWHVSLFKKEFPLPLVTFWIVVKKDAYLRKFWSIKPNAIEIKWRHYWWEEDYVMSYWKVLKRKWAYSYSQNELQPVNIKIVN